MRACTYLHTYLGKYANKKRPRLRRDRDLIEKTYHEEDVFDRRCSIAQRTIWARLVNSNLDRMLAMCFSTVRLLRTSSLAISPLVLPCAISVTTSRSRSLSPPSSSCSLDADSAGPNGKESAYSMPC